LRRSGTRNMFRRRESMGGRDLLSLQEKRA
jgi:hypothetical protein